MLNNKNNQGFTLIELIIALVVFTIGLTAALSLAMSNYNNSRDNLDKIIAANLAREGIELIRNVRDSNWLRADLNEISASGAYTWDYRLNSATPGNNGIVYIDFDDVNPESAGVSCNISNTACASTCDICKLYKDNNGYYVHDMAPSLLTPTKYSRVMFLKKICVEEAVADPQGKEYSRDMNEICNAHPGDTYIGVSIISQVNWEDNGTQHIEIVDNLYNWRS